MADSSSSGSTKLEAGLGRVGVPLQSVTLATLVIGGWQARGYLEEQLRTMEAMQASIEEIRSDSADTRAKATRSANELSDAISEASAKLLELQHRVDSNVRCLEKRKRNLRAECDK